MEEHHQETAEEGAQASHQQHGHWGDTAQLCSEARSSSQSSPPLTQSTHRSGRAPADPTSHEQRGTWKHLSQLPTGPEGIHTPRGGELQDPQYGVSRCGHLTPIFLPLVSFQNDSHVSDIGLSPGPQAYSQHSEPWRGKVTLIALRPPGPFPCGCPVHAKESERCQEKGAHGGEVPALGGR